LRDKTNSLQSADKEQQEVRAVAEKPRDAVVKFDTYRDVQRHRAVLPVIARLLLNIIKEIVYKRVLLISSVQISKKLVF